MKRSELMGATIIDMTIQKDRLWSIKLTLATGGDIILKTPYFRSPLWVEPAEPTAEINK